MYYRTGDRLTIIQCFLNFLRVSEVLKRVNSFSSHFDEVFCTTENVTFILFKVAQQSLMGTLNRTRWSVVLCKKKTHGTWSNWPRADKTWHKVSLTQDLLCHTQTVSYRVNLSEKRWESMKQVHPNVTVIHLKRFVSIKLVDFMFIVTNLLRIQLMKRIEVYQYDLGIVVYVTLSMACVFSW